VSSDRALLDIDVGLAGAVWLEGNQLDRVNVARLGEDARLEMTAVRAFAVDCVAGSTKLSRIRGVDGRVGPAGRQD
jgi:hypothetical protein